MLVRVTYCKQDRSIASQTFWAADAEAARAYARRLEDLNEDWVVLRLTRIRSRQAEFQPTKGRRPSTGASGGAKSPKT